MKKYILAGAGTVGIKAMEFLGEGDVYAFFDGKKAGTVLRGKKSSTSRSFVKFGKIMMSSSL